MAPKKKISLCMILKDEARYLESCLKAHASLVDEYVLVDTGSTDETPRIIQEYVGRVLRFAWCDDFSAARNFSLSQATGDWILVLDADEWIGEADQGRIRTLVEASGDEAFSFIQRSYTHDAGLYGYTRHRDPSAFDQRKSPWDARDTTGFIETRIVRLILNKPALGLRYVQRIHEGIEYESSKKQPVPTDIVLHHYGLLKGRDEQERKSVLYHHLEALRIRENPDDAESLRQFAAACLNGKEYDRAVFHYQKSLSLEADHAAALYGLGLSLFLKGDFEGAIPVLKKGCNLFPDNAHFLTTYGSLLLERGDLRGAEEILKAVLKFEPRETELTYNIAVYSMKNRDVDAALRMFREVLARDPRHENSLFNASLILYGMGLKDEAKALMAELVGINPGDPEARRKLDQWTGGGKEGRPF